MSTNAQRKQALAALADTYVPFKVGDGATYSIGADAYPVTVRRVSPSGHRVWVSNDEVIWVPGAPAGAHGFTNTHRFVPRDAQPSEWRMFTRRVNGRYVSSGSRRGGYLTRGRNYHQDPHF